MTSLRKRVIPILLLLTTILFFATIVQAQDKQARVGIRQGNSLNNLSISVTNYMGDCPG